MTDWKQAAIDAGHREAKACQARDTAYRSLFVIFAAFVAYVVLEHFK